MFDVSRCSKPFLKLVVSEIKLLKNKKEIHTTQLRRGGAVAQDPSGPNCWDTGAFDVRIISRMFECLRTLDVEVAIVDCR